MRGLFGTLAAGIRGGEVKSTDASDLTWERVMGRDAASNAGVHVNETTALKVSTVFGCLRVLANGIAQVPLKLYREDDDGRKTLAKEHPVYKLIYRRPNDWMTSFEFRQMMMFHAGLLDVAVAYIGRVRGEPRELVPLVPGTFTLKQDGSHEITCKLTTGRELAREDLFILRGPTWACAGDLGALHVAREATPGIVHRPAPYVPQPSTRIAVPSTPAAKASTVVADGLSRPQQRILDALAWLEWVGSHDVDKVRVAMLADQSPKSSGFRANLSTLSGLELLTHGGDKVSLTEDGRAAANKPAGNPTNAELHAAIRAKVSGPQWLMLQALINVYPGAMPRDGLAEASNQSPTSSGFRANLSTLSGLGFVKYVPNAMVRATDTLFVER